MTDDAVFFGAGCRNLWLVAVFCVFGFGLPGCADAWGDSISEARIVNASGSSFSLRYDDASQSYADGVGSNQNAYARVYAGSNSDLIGKYVCAAYAGGSSFRAATMSFEGDCEAMGDVAGNGPFFADTDVVFLSNRAYYPGIVYAVVSSDNMVSLDDVFVRIDPASGWLSGNDSGADGDYGSYDVGVSVVSGNVSVNVTCAYADDGGVIAVDYDYVVVSLVNSSGDVVDSVVTSLGDVVVLDSSGDDDVRVFVNGIEEWVYVAPLEPLDEGAGSGSGGGSGGGVVVVLDAGADDEGGNDTQCSEDWLCGNWSSCSPDGVQVRDCVDANGCGTVDFRPAVSVFCEYVPAEEKEEEPAALFDINVEMMDAGVEAGGELLVKVILVNFGGEGTVDAYLHYVVEDDSGVVVYDEREVVAVEVQKEFLKSFDVSALGAGEYNLFVDLEYAGQVAPARYAGGFDVLAPEPARFPYLAGVVVVVCLFVLYVSRDAVVYGFRRVWSGVSGVFVRRRGERLRARFVLDSSDALRRSFGGKGRVGLDGSGSCLRGRDDCPADDSHWSERERMRKDGDG